MTHDFNPRYVEYARYHGMTAEQMHAKEGHSNWRFMSWLVDKVRQAKADNQPFMNGINDFKECSIRYFLMISDHEALTTYLENHVHNKLMEHCL